MATRAILAAVLAVCIASGPAFAEGFYAIAHMTNSAAAVDWALGEGANAVEVDLQFDARARYIAHGTNGIMTNDPKALVSLLEAKQIPLASPRSTIPPATSTAVVRR